MKKRKILAILTLALFMITSSVMYAAYHDYDLVNQRTVKEYVTSHTYFDGYDSDNNPIVKKCKIYELVSYEKYKCKKCGHIKYEENHGSLIHSACGK